MSGSFDIIVIGAGIAGASVAAELSASNRVLLLEMESQPGYHTTGRSAAVFAPVYGPQPIRALTRASEAFFKNPPEGFSEHELFSPRKILMIAAEHQIDALDALIAECETETPVEKLTGDRLRAEQPLLRDGYCTAAMLDPNGQDIDVHALHQGYLKCFKKADGTLVTNAPVTALHRKAESWTVQAGGADYTAPILVNAAGAWADEIGKLAGADKIGLVPKRRTALMIASPSPEISDPLPITVDVDEEFYLKPDAGRLLISPANEDPSAPCDAQPEELDIALCIDRIERAFDVPVGRIENKWAGLRSFVSDKCPAVGYSEKTPGFFWLAGQGGYGIQTAPALACLAASMILKQDPPEDIMKEGLNLADLSPDRFG
ncbi:MAG: FAD-binding oxidoreductase, partial [Sneathiellales bacterium]|nr:FAD-binding oxidoreductase [Sneathiellales bacterium]